MPAKNLPPFHHRVAFNDGTRVIVEITPENSVNYRVRCYVKDAMLVDCLFDPSPGVGFNNGSIQNEEIGKALEDACRRRYKKGALPPLKGAV